MNKINNILICVLRVLIIFFSISYFNYSNASDGFCVDKNIKEYDPVKLIYQLGSNLPKRVENYSRIFGNDIRSYPISRASHHYADERITDGIVKVAQDSQLCNGIRLNFIELRIINPPYVSEVYFNFNNKEKYNCLHASEIRKRFLSKHDNIDKNNFYYSSILNVRLKFSVQGRGDNSCISNMDMMYIAR